MAEPLDLTSEGIERLRRSVAMLAPMRPDGLAREQALRVLEELQAAQARCRDLEAALGEGEAPGL
ncbi:MAG: hypothetical protein JO367_00850 [Actinobacteria bacterium]|nr:hypothetical protein [Actinomycetota bacterium]MBV9254410.1 hypothetical protein [Actinomycetota bacterium]MBV9932822.1 hypothetical protein [Actinomycetota bacterium]